MNQQQMLCGTQPGPRLKKTSAKAAEQDNNLSNSLKTRDKLRLAGFVVCMLCGKSTKSGSKVYWESNIRCCKDCLILHSVAESYLIEEYGLEPLSFHHLPNRQVEFSIAAKATSG